MARPNRLPILSTASKAGMTAAIAVVGTLAIYASLAPRPAAASEDAVVMAAVTAAALVQATNGQAASQLKAVGEDAMAINAALPLSAGPVAAARPFLVPSGGLDERRALECLTQTVYYEAGYEPVDGRRAVAQVVLNRMRHPAFPNSVCGVVYQRSRGVCQFTFVCDGALYRSPETGAWRQARAIAQAALAGYVERSVGVATHYHADYVAPRWAPLLAKVSQIGTHIFYRWPGAWGRPQAFAGRYVGEPSDPAALRPPLRMHAAAEELGPIAVAATVGPPVRRAPNDVGGLLDTSKGWKLTIPDPRKIGSTAARVISNQQTAARAVPAPIAVASAAAPVSTAPKGLE